MSHFIYTHINTILPQHFYDSIHCLKKVEVSPIIYLITDQNIVIEGVITIHVEEVISKQTKAVFEMKLFKNETNLLWRTSIFRIFLLRDTMKYLNISNFYHFDTDVLLFVPSYKYDTVFLNFDGLLITKCNENEYVLGFSRFGSFSKTEELCNMLYKILFTRFLYLKNFILRRKYFLNMPNEMQLLAGIAKRRPDLIKSLCILPNIDETYVFDPSSYGQYFGGTNLGHLPGFKSTDHIIGNEISIGNIIPLMIDNKPFVKKGQNLYPIVNLHIHSKRTNEFLIF
jgi:hypothetical protein